MKKNNKGFSLVELIVVVLILGILAVAVTPQIMNWVETSKVNTDETTKESIEVAAQAAVLEFMATSAIAAEDYKVLSTGVTVLDAGTDANTGLAAKIQTAIGAVANPKQSGKNYYKVAVDANGQVTVTIES